MQKSSLIFVAQKTAPKNNVSEGLKTKRCKKINQRSFRRAHIRVTFELPPQVGTEDCTHAFFHTHSFAYMLIPKPLMNISRNPSIISGFYSIGRVQTNNYLCKEESFFMLSPEAFFYMRTVYVHLNTQTSLQLKGLCSFSINRASVYNQKRINYTPGEVR